MISEKMQEQLNKQLNVEFFSAYLYLAGAAYCHSISMNGFAHWFEVQAREELVHGMKFYKFLNDRGGTVKLRPIDQPPATFESLVQLFEKGYEHEKHVTSLLNALVGFSLEDKDYATNAFLQWFITEQIEEESTVSDLLQALKLIKNDGQGLIMLDRELAGRPMEAEGE